jgi:hypothetical protein
MDEGENKEMSISDILDNMDLRGAAPRPRGGARRQYGRGKSDEQVKAEILAIYAERAENGEGIPTAYQLRSGIRNASEQRVRQIRMTMILGGEIAAPKMSRSVTAATIQQAAGCRPRDAARDRPPRADRHPSGAIVREHFRAIRSLRQWASLWSKRDLSASDICTPR